MANQRKQDTTNPTYPQPNRDEDENEESRS